MKTAREKFISWVSNKEGEKVAAACTRKLGKERFTVPKGLAILCQVLERQHRKTYVPPSPEALPLNRGKLVKGTFDFDRRAAR